MDEPSQLGNGLTQADRNKLAKLVNRWHELEMAHREKVDAIMAEVFAVLRGNVGLGPRLTALKTHWCDVWSERHLEPCVFDHVAHSAELKKKMLAYGDDVVKAKMSNYVTSDDPFHLKQRHPFRLFIATFDTWRGLPQAPDLSAETRDRLQGLRGE